MFWYGAGSGIVVSALAVLEISGPLFVDLQMWLFMDRSFGTPSPWRPEPSPVGGNALTAGAAGLVWSG